MTIEWGLSMITKRMVNILSNIFRLTALILFIVFLIVK
nr:MAG TPA_asm: hypothetical protein [Caudoviricetes sp.]